jgi:hypothetical protein
MLSHDATLLIAPLYRGMSRRFPAQEDVEVGYRVVRVFRPKPRACRVVIYTPAAGERECIWLLQFAKQVAAVGVINGDRTPYSLHNKKEK